MYLIHPWNSMEMYLSYLSYFSISFEQKYVLYITEILLIQRVELRIFYSCKNKLQSNFSCHIVEK